MAAPRGCGAIAGCSLEVGLAELLKESFPKTQQHRAQPPGGPRSLTALLGSESSSLQGHPKSLLGMMQPHA